MMERLFFWRRPGQARREAENPGESSALLTGDAQQDAQSLGILLHTIAEVSANIDLDKVLEDIVDKSLEVSDAERSLLLLGSSADALEVKIARSKDGSSLDRDIVYSKTLVRRCLEEGHAERSVVQSDQEALELGQSVYNLKLRAVLCAPLQVKGRTHGVIYVDSKAVRREFSSRDQALFSALSHQLAVAIENARLYSDSLQKVRLEKDFEIAKRIQQHLLSPVPEELPGIDLALRFSARDEASGDTYDFIPLDESRLIVMIGDVTGHGVGAALLTHAAQAAMRSYFELVDDLPDVARRLNDRLVESVETGNFMSVLLLLIDVKKRTLHYVNGGHPSLILVRDGEIHEFEKTAMVMGVVGEQEYPSEGPIDLRVGDTLFMRTDGVDETMNPERELFGSERLCAILKSASASSADQVLSNVEAATAEHARGVRQDDDLTMIAIRILDT